MYLLSSSLMVTVALLEVPGVTPLGSEDGSIVTVKSSLPSGIPSLIIGTSKDTLVTPAGIVTVYGPET